ncbi:endolytic transglycosylase MltG [Nocardia camponoti]|uniref:Endolytic murein transglycosylase n=1 Tax=Nocardia camponoti TaxID=1616106 RepID=A0A917V4Q8_9NOCA|nr:endolytic transglycosylase MltG [Nocardia camponoti]GGK39531.1 hypothetical protein GCM10011591_09030 [Nocardia camponoti]
MTTDRWARAEERYRAREADRRYPRREWDSEPAAEPAAPAARGWDDDPATDEIPVYRDDAPYYEPAAEYEPAAAAYAAEPDYEADYAGAYSDEPEQVAEPEPEPTPPPRRVGKRAAPASGKGRAGPRPSRASARKAAARQAAARKRRRRRWLVLGVAFVVVVALAGFGGYKLMGRFTPPEDFAGPSGAPVVIQVHSGDTANEIAKTMKAKGVVASEEAFYAAAVRNSNMNGVQPGYYAVAQHSPAAEAVTALVSKDARVGNLVISEGRQLHDTTDVNTGARKEGVYTKIAAASCVASKCVTYEQLDAAGSGNDLAALGVPDWAKKSVAAAPDRRRQLDGLIAAGTLDFDPTGGAVDILRQLITDSAARYEGTGLLKSGASTQLDPYQTLIAASLVEREALPSDMPKVARVIVNRLKVDQQLQFDSTVNYSLDHTEVATTDADRQRKTPWNTYAMTGLPANPIAAPSLQALRAMENPEAGPWLYFVTIDKKGTTLFTESYAEHLRNIQKAQQSGILDSGR